MLPRLKELRKEYGISQQRLADAIYVTQPSINKYENHNIEPEIAILIRIADFFNTSVDYLIGHTDVRRPIEATESFQLNAQEAALLSGYRGLRPDERACVQQIILTFLKGHEKRPERFTPDR